MRSIEEHNVYAPHVTLTRLKISIKDDEIDGIVIFNRTGAVSGHPGRADTVRGAGRWWTRTRRRDVSSARHGREEGAAAGGREGERARSARVRKGE